MTRAGASDHTRRKTRFEITTSWLRALLAAPLLIAIGVVALAVIKAPERVVEQPAPTMRSQLTPPSARQPLPAASADLEEIRRIERADGVSTQRARPAMSTYVKDVVMAGFVGIARWFEGVSVSGNVLVTAVAWTLGLSAIVVIALVGWRFYVRWSGGARSTDRTTAVTLETPTPSMIDWRQRLDTALQEGRARDALEALWWWFAQRLGACSADPAWTTRELVTHAERRDLWPLVSRFDRLVYGQGEPRIDDVRSLLEAVRDALPSAQPTERATP